MTTFISISKEEILSLLLVGTIWGATNPFLRKGSTNNKQDATTTPSSSPSSSSTINNTPPKTNGIIKPLFSFLLQFISKIKSISVWLPYLINQSGSILFYKCLATSDLSIVVPICNAIALIVSAIVGYYGRPFGVGERMDQPWKAFFGIFSILCGVALCMQDKNMENTPEKEIHQEL